MVPISPGAFNLLDLVRLRLDEYRGHQGRPVWTFYCSKKSKLEPGVSKSAPNYAKLIAIACSQSALVLKTAWIWLVRGWIVVEDIGTDLFGSSAGPHIVVKSSLGLIGNTKWQCLSHFWTPLGPNVFFWQMSKLVGPDVLYTDPTSIQPDPASWDHLGWLGLVNSHVWRSLNHFWTQLGPEWDFFEAAQDPKWSVLMSSTVFYDNPTSIQPDPASFHHQS